MSTAGRVLTGLIVVVVAAWVLLASAVAQLNTEWTQALDRLTKEVAKLETQVADNEREILRVKDEVALEQDKSEADQSVIRSRLAQIERARADTIQIQTAVANQLDTVKAAVKTAESARTQRNAELDAEKKAKAEAEKQVEALKAEDSELLDRLLALRKEFKEIVESNKALVERIERAGGGRKPVRRTSSAR